MRLKMLSTAWMTRAALAATLCMTLAATGCGQTTTAIGATSVACGSFEPIRWSTRDTDETIVAVKGHNAAGKALGCWD